MTLILDAGALVAVERSNRDVIALIKGEQLADRAPLTHGGIIGQVWRGGAGRQALLAKLLPTLEIVALDESLGRRAGVLLVQSKTSDVIDAALALLAAADDMILTSDAGDMRRLVRAANLDVDVTEV